MLHERIVLVSVQVFDVPYVPEIDRVEILYKLKGDFYRVIVQYGFKDEPDIPAALALCRSRSRDGDARHLLLPRARDTIPRFGSEMSFWRTKLFIAMFRNAGSATAFFKIPSNRVVELGTQIVL